MRSVAFTTLALAALVASSCANDPQTPEERKGVGDAWIRKMDDRFGSATGVSVSIRGTRQRTQDGMSVTVPFTLDLVVRGSGGIHARQVVNEQASEAWYDGTTLTLLSEAEGTVQEMPLGSSQDAALTRIGEAFELAPSLAALFSAAPYWNVLADGSTGGWRGRQSVGGVLCEHLSYQHPRQDLEMWIASSGDPLPQRIAITRREPTGQITTDASFSNWNLATGSPDEVFRPPSPR